MGRYGQVIKEVDAALALDPPYHPRCLIEREQGVALWHLGKKAEARAILSEAADSEDAEHYDALARVVGETTRLGLAILEARGSPKRAAVVARRSIKGLRAYKPGLGRYGDELRRLSDLCRRLDRKGGPVDADIASFTKCSGSLLELIAW